MFSISDNLNSLFINQQFSMLGGGYNKDCKQQVFNEETTTDQTSLENESLYGLNQCNNYAKFLNIDENLEKPSTPSSIISENEPISYYQQNFPNNLINSKNEIESINENHQFQKITHQDQELVKIEDQENNQQFIIFQREKGFEIGKNMNEREISKMLEKSKRILKREKAKNRVFLQQQKLLEQQNGTFQPQDYEKQEQMSPQIQANQDAYSVNEIKQEHKKEEQDIYVNFSGNQQPDSWNPHESIKKKDPEDSSQNKKQKEIMQKIRNRISAQQSRDRKKAYIQKLEKDVNILNDDRSDILKKIDLLEKENKSMKNQIEQLKNKKYVRKNSGHGKQFDSQSIEQIQEQTVSVSNENNMVVPKDKLDNYKFGVALFTILSLFMMLNWNLKNKLGQMGVKDENNNLFIDNGSNSQLNIQNNDFIIKKQEMIMEKLRHMKKINILKQKSSEFQRKKQRGRRKKNQDLDKEGVVGDRHLVAYFPNEYILQNQQSQYNQIEKYQYIQLLKPSSNNDKENSQFEKILCKIEKTEKIELE